MFIQFSIISGLEFWLVNHTPIYQNSNIFKNIELLGEISNNWPNNLLGTNVQKTWILLMIITDNITMDYYYFSNS